MAKEQKRKAARPIRVGVIGVGRGHGFAAGAGPHLGMELVALCDTWEERLLKVGGQLGVTTYTDYDKFLEHDMDAVILANYFHQHAPFATKALEAGMHVMSETSACFTLAEGVALVEAVEKSGRTYMFAENYPYMLFNQEMRRLYQAGRVGTFMYGEGEYVHPMSADEYNRISPGVDHWRNWLPATYYCTHALAPVMFITDTRPAKVNGFIIPGREDDPVAQRTARCGDPASMIALRMDSGAVVKLLQVGLRGHGIWVRIHGSQGHMENLRYGDGNVVWFRRENYHERDGQPEETTVRAEFPPEHGAAARTGHGGGDYFMNYHFAEAIRTGESPYWDVYRGVAASIVGILAYRSALADAEPLEVPDFRDRDVRLRYAEDHWSPDPARRAPGDPWPSVFGNLSPSAEALAYARKNWAAVGYEET
jgi:predicted dehydrogenase